MGMVDHGTGLIMSTAEQKHQIVLEHEEGFADRLALQVLDKPKLSVWMILIPIIFVHYFYRIQKFNSGRNAFAQNYMVLRKRALAEALAAVHSDNAPDIEGLSRMSKLPDSAEKPNRVLLQHLVSHYMDLIRSAGDTMESLVRSAYKTRTNYLLFINQLSQAERTLNSALKPHLAETVQGIEDIIAAMEQHSEKLRRNHAAMVFP